MTKPAGLSLADLNARQHGAEAFEFEYLLQDGSGSGVFLSVLGAQSEKVTGEINRLVNERRKKEQVQAARNAGSRAASAEFIPVEDDIAFGQRLSAVRLVGWRGITDPFTPENALALCQSNADVAAQVLEASNETANFLKLSSPTS